MLAINSKDCMKFPFPWSLKPRTASLEELREQLGNARASYESAQAATQSAQTVFDDAGEASAEKALLAARSAEQSAAEHLGRAERLVEAAENQRKAEERARLKARRAELEAQTSFPALNAACGPLFQAAADHLAAFADARVALAKQAADFLALETELEAVTVALGEPRKRGIIENEDGTSTLYSVRSDADLAADAGSILVRLAPRLESLPSQHPLHALVHELAEAGPCHFTGVDADS